jgi:hypothetical protein
MQFPPGPHAQHLPAVQQLHHFNAQSTHDSIHAELALSNLNLREQLTQSEQNITQCQQEFNKLQQYTILLQQQLQASQCMAGHFSAQLLTVAAEQQVTADHHAMELTSLECVKAAEIQHLQDAMKFAAARNSTALTVKEVELKELHDKTQSLCAEHSAAMEALDTSKTTEIKELLQKLNIALKEYTSSSTALDERNAYLIAENQSKQRRIDAQTARIDSAEKDVELFRAMLKESDERHIFACIESKRFASRIQELERQLAFTCDQSLQHARIQQQQHASASVSISTVQNVEQLQGVLSSRVAEVERLQGENAELVRNGLQSEKKLRKIKHKMDVLVREQNKVPNADDKQRLLQVQQDLVVMVHAVVMQGDALIEMKSTSVENLNLLQTISERLASLTPEDLVTESKEITKNINTQLNITIKAMTGHYATELRLMRAEDQVVTDTVAMLVELCSMIVIAIPTTMTNTMAKKVRIDLEKLKKRFVMGTPFLRRTHDVEDRIKTFLARTMANGSTML